ncbi:hypothetical protein R7R25_24280 [Vibrio sp. 2026]|uniref:hypothetical protein n=1 Tax=Vibrio TaxID=662 RepID=UPI001C063C6A|nr:MULTISPECIES: hypothetical protein [Vibrio]ELB2770313.1 hypothetical protein [Vibrio alginolyticus]MCR9438402.1 hypothetical protein [Vibrio alginolyticus]MDW1517962.1 hypothetical protein [Vibrio sp. Vb5035]MDW1548142.1 hypothetical protein [Vibrio sp. Vb5034]MDW1779572.1 hypothetical protein [Vibrio sp. Vb2175]
MKKLKNWLIERVLKHVVSQNCPARIPRSGDAGSKVRCYSTVIKVMGKEELLAKQVTDGKVIGYLWDKHLQRFDEEATIELHWLEPNSLDIRRYIGYFEVTYESLWDYLINDQTGYMAFRAFLFRTRSRVAQYVFNKRTLELKKRHELLSFLIQNYGSMRSEFSLITLMHKAYSLYSFHHPDKEKLKRLLELQLDSFVQSGEIKRQDGSYKLTGKAIQTLETFQLESRRHKMAVIQQWLMITLTFVLALIGLVQANIIKFPTVWELKII